MRITSKEIFTEENHGTIVLETAATPRVTITQQGTAIWAVSATDQSGARLVGTVGGTASATAASAASGATLSTIAHGLAATPTNFTVNAGNAAAAAIVANGFFVTADGTNVSVATAASAASGTYAWQWLATP